MRMSWSIPGPLQVQVPKANTALFIDNTRMTMHKKKKAKLPRSPSSPLSPYLGSWVISAYTTFLYLSFFLIISSFFLHFRTKEEWSSGEPIVGSGLVFFLDGWMDGWGLADWIKSTNCNSNDYAYFHTLFLFYFSLRVAVRTFISRSVQSCVLSREILRCPASYTRWRAGSLHIFRGI